MKKILILILMLILCSCGVQKVDESGKISIITTVFPQYDFARNIGGELCNYQMLLKPGSEAHTYEPSPADIIALSKCDLFICVGGESESWVAKMIQSAEISEERVIRLYDLIDEKQEIEDAHGHTEYDEHVWTSPKNALIISKAITDKMSELDSKNADIYKENYIKYENKLNSLDESFSNLEKTREIIVGDRFPLIYLTEEYGIEYRSAIAGCGEHSEASPSVVADLSDTVEKEKIPVVFKVDFSNGKIAEIIASVSAAKVLTLRSCHTVTSDEFEQGIGYLELMEENLKNITEAMQ